MPVSPLQYAQQHREEAVRDLQDLLRIPSISTLPEQQPDMARAASWLRDFLQGMGIEAEIVGTGHPLVIGQWLGATGAPTVLVYGHYDVQPVDPLELWDTPPFEPTLRNGSLFARGASDDKGQTMTLLTAARSFMETTGELPVNVRILIEGQEECGGEAVESYVRTHPERLSADFVQIADSVMFAPGVPAIETGLRGIVYVEIHVHGAEHDLHSGLYGGVAPNPLNAIAHIVAGLKDSSGRITVDGFYENVRRPDERILESWRALEFDEAQYLKEEIGAPALVGEEGFSVLERTWARPTLDVHGISGGFTGVGAKTVIPASATAKVSMRLVPDQEPDEIFELLKRRVEQLTPPGVVADVRCIHGADPVLVPESSPYVTAAQEALEETFGRPGVLGRSGGSIPIVGVLKQVLGLDSLLMGWGLPDDNLHAPNEKLSLENFFLGTEATIRFWNKMGSMTPRST